MRLGYLSFVLLLLACAAGCGGQNLISALPSTKVSSTPNPQVALYSVSAEQTGNISVQFGPDTNYGLTTWQQPAVPGGATNLFVAGMKASTPYHMRAVMTFSDGSQWTDADHVFTTGSLNSSGSAQGPTITTTTTPGMTPQSGVELLAVVAGNPVVTDLSGNILWSYAAVPTGDFAGPIKLIPSGHFLINFSGAAVDGENSVIQEVDLTGTIIWQMTAADLNAALAAATCPGCNITVIGTHHDFAILPNGHLIVIASTQQNVSGTTVTGDVIIDLDPNHKPVWLWNEFDHLDINRRPMGFPDWTHTNAVLYSPDDGNLIVSSRHQSWLIKVDYANGAGAGDILWKLGYQGDFTLQGGTDPMDWFYAQHGPSFATTNTTGKFSLALFDNGDDRVFPTGMPCIGPGGQACPYSTVPILDLDETTMAATISLNPAAPTYSFFGGNAEVLQNGDLEFCESAGGPGTTGDIYEVAQDSSARTIWQMQIAGTYVYRGLRLPSLYPGVQW